MELEEWRGAVVDPVLPTGASGSVTDPAGPTVPPGSRGSSGAASSPAPPDPEEWSRVTIPGSPAEFAGADAVAYRTTFLDPRDGDDGRALLEFEGLYAHARVWINGEYLGGHDTHFAPARFTFEPRVANEVVVLCRRPEDRFGGVLDTSLVATEDSVPSIRWGARVRAVPGNFITDLSLRPRESDEDGDEAWIDATVTVDAGTDLDERVALSLAAEGFEGGSAMTQVGASASAGERITVAGRLSVRDPPRWWPHGFGEQHRYAVTASLGASERTATTGFVTYEYGEDGLMVNGTRVPARGIETLPERSEANSSESDPAAAVERALDANATLVRPHAHVPPVEFYRACDEAGIMVWQPLPYCTGAFDVERGRAVARTLGERHGHRPSLAAFGMFDAPERFFEESDADGERAGGSALSVSGLLSDAEAASPSGTTSVETATSESEPGDRGWQVRRGLGDVTHGAAAAAVVGTLPEERPALPTPGLPGTSAQYPAWDRSSGESETGDEGTGASPVSWVLDGRGHLADVPVLTRCELPEHGANATDATVPTDARVASGPDRARETLTTVVEALRRTDPDLLTAFGLGVATTPAEGSGSGPSASNPGAALAGVFEPVQVFLDGPTTGTVGVTMVNDTPERVTGSLDWTAGEETGSVEVDVEALSRESVGEIRVPETAERVELSLDCGDRMVTNRYER